MRAHGQKDFAEKSSGNAKLNCTFAGAADRGGLDGLPSHPMHAEHGVLGDLKN
jgi:hypothetical protein